jgi:hypothetical protein
MAVANKIKREFCMQSNSKTDDRQALGSGEAVRTVLLSFCLPGHTGETDVWKEQYEIT